MDFLAGEPIAELKQIGKRADDEAKEKAKGFEVGYERRFRPWISDRRSKAGSSNAEMLDLKRPFMQS